MIEKDGKEYLTVAEFAESAGISKQAVYFQLDSRLEPYLIQVENKKMIEKSALERFYSSQVDSSCSSQNSSFSQVDSSQIQVKNPAEKTDLTKEMFDLLKQDLEKKDKQIEKLQNSVLELSRQISELAKGSIYITAADKTEKIMQNTSENIVEPAAAAAENQEKEENQNTENKKKWFQFWKN